MNNSLPLPEDIAKQEAGMAVIDAFHFWNKKRSLFNIIVGTSGIVSLLLFGQSFYLYDVFGIIMWGITANALYTAGYILDSFMIAGMKNLKGLGNTRPALFWIGTITYALVSISFCYLYYTFPF